MAQKNAIYFGNIGSNPMTQYAKVQYPNPFGNTLETRNAYTSGDALFDATGLDTTKFSNATGTTNQSLGAINNGSMFGGISDWWKNQSNPRGMSTADMNKLTALTDANGNPIRSQTEADKNAIALGSQKTGWEQIGATASGIGSLAGGLAGAYTAYQNAEYQKRQEGLQNRMIASDNANKSAFARAAGGTYVPA